MDNYRLIEKILFLPTTFNKDKFTRAVAGKTILITGASSGIGEQVAYQFANSDVHLILVARREPELAAIKQEIERKKATVSIFPADLRNEEEMEKLLAFIHQLPQGLDIVVSNAGLSINRPINRSLDRYHDFTRTMAINYFAPVRLLLSVIPLLKQKRGQILNVSTINVLLTPLPYWAGYQASKSAFDTWLRSAAPELKQMGICTTSIYLPLVNTPMIKPTTAYENMPAMSAEHVATIICQRMYSKKKVYRPWWIPLGQIFSMLFRSILEAGFTKWVRKKEEQH